MANVTDRMAMNDRGGSQWIWLSMSVLVIAGHGSWNRSIKDGYKVVSLHWKEGGDIEERDFITGFMAGDEVFGRPVAIAEAADGALYISDDYAGVIYRLTYK